MSRILVDTNILIYLFEDDSEFGSRSRQLFENMNLRNDTVVVSSMSFGELLVKPKKDANNAVVTHYLEFFQSGLVEVVDFNVSCSETFSDLRAQFAIKSPDAIQLSCAKEAKCDFMVTNDLRLSGIFLPGLPIVLSLGTSPI